MVLHQLGEAPSFAEVLPALQGQGLPDLLGLDDFLLELLLLLLLSAVVHLKLAAISGIDLLEKAVDLERLLLLQEVDAFEVGDGHANRGGTG